MEPIRTHDFSLVPFQQDAVEAWVRGTDGHPFRGTLSIATGGGKTLIALECIARASEESPDLKVAIVVPAVALAEQWAQVVTRYTSIDREQIGRLGGGRRNVGFDSHRVIIAVLNSAAKSLPDLAAGVQPLMLVVDECHRAGAPRLSRVLTTPADYRLGLSATPEREEFDDRGQPLAYDEQLLGERLGGVVYQFTLGDARAAGWLPEYSIHHHGVALVREEPERYARLSRRVDDAADSLRALGGDTSRGQQLARRPGELGDAARQYVASTAERKDLLYRAAERHRVVGELLARAFADARQPPRAILFHERVDEAGDLYAQLVQRCPEVPMALEHSGLGARERRSALKAFAEGSARVLVSVKSLVEGIDVPEADLGISVASTSSVRQRIQSLGRVLRRSQDGDKTATMHILYVRDSVDDVIYGKADWSELTGEGVNHYWNWPPLEGEPEPAEGPPRTPLPTESQVHEQAETLIPALPCPWPGEVVGQEYSVSMNGTVHNAFKALIANPQGVADMVAALRGRPGGRFRVTPLHRYVLVWDRNATPPGFAIVGQLAAPFHVALEAAEGTALHSAAPLGSRQGEGAVLKAGTEFHGSPDKYNGTFKISQRAGGVIERVSPGGGRELALLDGSGQPDLEENARRLIDNWNGLGRPVSRCFLNAEWQAWYELEGARRYLASVPGGFAWPTQDDEGTEIQL